MINKLVSILISTYNRGNFLKILSIPSILTQTYKEWELIVVDDASNDNTAEIINDLKKKIKRLKYLRFDKNRGYAATINEGIKLAEGDYVALLDADDAWFSNKLEKQLRFIESNDLIGCTSLVLQYDIEKSRVVGIASIGLPGFIAKRNLFDLILPLDENLRGIEDGDFFIKMELAKVNSKIKESDFRFSVLKEPLVFYNRHQKATSFFNLDKAKILRDRYKLLINKYNKYNKYDSIINEKRTTSNLRAIFFNSYMRLGFYEAVLNNKKESTLYFLKAFSLKRSLIPLLLGFLVLLLPTSQLFKIKFLVRNIIIENIIYKINMLRYKKFLKLLRSEIEEFINKAKLLQS